MKNKIFPDQKSYVKKGGFFQNDKKNKTPFKKEEPNFRKIKDGGAANPTIRKSGFFLKDNSYKKKFYAKHKEQEIPRKDKMEMAEIAKVDKKPFDKKTYRLKKYSMKYKLDKFEENRKKSVLKNYYKELKSGLPLGQKYIDKGFDETLGTDSEEEMKKNEDENVDSGEKVVEEKEMPRKKNYVMNPDYVPSTKAVEETKLNNSQKRGFAFRAANQEFSRLKEAKIAKKAEVEKSKTDKEEALKIYKQNKAEKFKKLNKKTKKGQPVMKARLEMLLEQIQKKM